MHAHTHAHAHARSIGPAPPKTTMGGSEQVLALR